MLVAEEVAGRTGRELDFKDWDGDDGGKSWARSVRQLLCEKDTDVEIQDDDEEPELPIEDTPEVDDFEPAGEPVRPSRPSVVPSDGHDSDDSLTGYASQPSSRSPSPTPSELAEIEKDPTIRVGQTKISRPVYLAQLGEMIRGTSGLKTGQENQEAEKIEIALNVAEELIRRRRGYGTELGWLFVGQLNHTFVLIRFQKRRMQLISSMAWLAYITIMNWMVSTLSVKLR